MRPPGTASQLHRRRLYALRLRRAGKSLSEVARHTGANKSSICRWEISHRRQGLKGVEPTPIPGRPAKLTPRQTQSLTTRLAKGALTEGYEADYWSLARIRQLLWTQFHLHYVSSGVWYLLQRLGWSCQKPQTRAIQRDEKQIAHWVRYVWPQIKKNFRVAGQPCFP